MIGNKYVVYLAGPMAGLTQAEACAWRDLVADALGSDFICLSPPHCDAVVGRYEKTLPDAEAIASPFDILRTDVGITHRDYTALKSSDAVLANLTGGPNEISIGTIMEIAWAFSLGIPCFVAIEDGSVHDHVMVRSIAVVRHPKLFVITDAISRFFISRHPAGSVHSQTKLR